MSYRLPLTLALFILCCGSLLAQSYNLQVSTGTYVNIVDEFVLSSDTIAEAYALNASFNMRSYDRSFDYSTGRFRVTRDGYVFISDSLYVMEEYGAGRK